MFLIIITVSGCAEKISVDYNIKNEITRKTAETDKEIVDNNTVRFYVYLEDNLYQISLKIMKHEAAISKAGSYNVILENINAIKNYLNESMEVINRYEKRSNDTKYQKHIGYVRCTYKNLQKSYLFMESEVKNELEKNSKNNINKFKDKMRNNVSELFINNMQDCKKN